MVSDDDLGGQARNDLHRGSRQKRSVWSQTRLVRSNYYIVDRHTADMLRGGAYMCVSYIDVSDWMAQSRVIVRKDLPLYGPVALKLCQALGSLRVAISRAAAMKILFGKKSIGLQVSVFLTILLLISSEWGCAFIGHHFTLFGHALMQHTTKFHSVEEPNKAIR